jgi:protoheme IX farnesyltransferase
MKPSISIWLELGKVRITMAVSVTTVAGYLLYSTSPGMDLVLTISGIFLLASGASALNQIQELRYDSRMERTRHRPLPSGRISRSGAAVVTLVYSVTGGILLFLGCEWGGLLLGVLTYFLYNVVYTYLKRYTPWAVIPGALIGSIPPVIGWVSAGGSITDPAFLPIAAFFFVWQVPHFWLLIMKYGEEYKAAGFASLSDSMTDVQIGRMIFIWITGTSIVTVIFTVLGPVDSLFCRACLWIVSAWLILVFIPILKRSLSGFHPRRYFMKINYFVLLAVLFMCLDRIFAQNFQSLF